MVASIISKKLAAGSTHLLIDLPVGPTAKLANASEAMRLRKLFEFVGDQFGIAVEVITTDGRQPIGNGIGPVLEASDVMAVLANEPDAPADLREKSLRLAAHLLEYDPQLRGGAGYARARELLDSGAALKKMQEIIDAQGPSSCRNDIGKLTFDVRAADDGAISEIDCLQLNRLARTAGAPIDKGAGIRLFSKIGDRVEKGQPLYRIHAYDQSGARSRRDGRNTQQRICHRRSAAAACRDRRRERGHSEPAVVLARRRRASPPGLACRFTRSPSTPFPTAKYG